MAKLKLTEALISALEADKGCETIIWDTIQPGFGVKIAPKGRKTYLVYYRMLDGQQRKPSLGLTSDLSLKEARERAQDYRSAARKGRDLSRERQERRKTITIQEFSKIYIEDHARKKKKPRSVKEDEMNLRNHINKRLGQIKINQITRQQVINFHQNMETTPGAANRCLSLLSKMFNLAEAWGYRKDNTNPCRYVERYKENKRERYLSTKELSQLGAALRDAETNKTERFASIAAIRLLLLTGSRKSEILELKWKYVDINASCLRLPDSKTGAKIIWLNAPALRILSKLKENNIEQSPWVISGLRKNRPLINIAKPWTRICKAAKLKDLRLHDLRHSFASIAANAGHGLPLIGALLGHKDTSTTARYAHLTADPVKQANQQIGAALEEALSYNKTNGEI